MYLLLGFGLQAFAAWGYTGEEGPSYWGELSPDYQLCNTGTQQSPVDISSAYIGNGSGLESLKFEYGNTPLEVENNIHAIKVEYEPGAQVWVGSKKYSLLEFHLHSPSEHARDGRYLPMEVHFVHTDEQGEILIVSVLMQEGKANNTLKKVLAAAPSEKAVNFVPGGVLNARDLLPTNTQNYFTYTGSLTEPPCTEGVKWVVLQDFVEVSHNQVEQFLGVVHENSRSLQPLNGRSILTRQ
jgi:carbonic anhydrase